MKYWFGQCTVNGGTVMFFWFDQFSCQNEIRNYSFINFTLA